MTVPLVEKVKVGCSGWSYKDWSGPFYATSLPARDYLKFYSSVFDSVEIDSSFYRIPSSTMVEQWKRITPDGFKFCPKLPKKITHEKKLQDFESTLTYFYSSVSKLGDKLGPIVVQLPPSIKVDKHWDIMNHFVQGLNSKYSHAVEFRHKSWFGAETYKLLSDKNIALAWSLNQYLETPSEVTADFVYLRMVGERDITDFGSKQKERGEEMARWADTLKGKSRSFEDGYVFFNNHFAGFGPESVNEFRRLLGMIEIDWKKARDSRTRGQRRPSDGSEDTHQSTLAGF